MNIYILWLALIALLCLIGIIIFVRDIRKTFVISDRIERESRENDERIEREATERRERLNRELIESLHREAQRRQATPKHRARAYPIAARSAAPKTAQQNSMPVQSAALDPLVLNPAPDFSQPLSFAHFAPAKACNARSFAPDSSPSYSCDSSSSYDSSSSSSCDSSSSSCGGGGE